MSKLDLFAPAPKALEGLLAEELTALGGSDVAEKRAGVSFTGTLETAYRICLWSRIANRVLLPLTTFDAADTDALYAGVQTVAWREHLGVSDTLAVDATATRAAIDNTHFASRRVKDAVVDQFRTHTGQRPSVDPKTPDVRINLHLEGERGTVSIDLSGESLHRRGYRLRGASAPLKENLAAAVLAWSGWPEAARAGHSFLDPMCGSGTLCIEAALMATDTAPGLLREYFGFLAWRGHDRALWRRLVHEARERRRAGHTRAPTIVGYDVDKGAVRVAQENVERAGLRGVIHVERRDLVALAPTAALADSPGLVVTNPPYGERLGANQDLQALYSTLGARLKQGFDGWTAVVMTSDDELGKRLGLRAARRRRVYNGTIACRLLELPVGGRPQVVSEQRTMLVNRLRKRHDHLKKWARRRGIYCYRVYDADLPEYAAAVDLYEDWVVIQEYEPPKTVPLARAAQRLQDLLAVVPEVLGVASERVVVKVRHRQRGKSQYGKLARTGQLESVREGDHRFLVNLRDYVDTGLFLDGRRIRALIGELAAGRRFLNLFAYTGTATVYAAGGGATGSTSVDMSKTYLEWARQNFQANGLRARVHEVVTADCVEFVARARRKYGLIYLDPPTFSKSKRMVGTLDLQRDHVELLRASARLLEDDGVLLFSCHARKLDIDTGELSELRVEEITARTVDEDFARGRAPHRCWKITRA